MTPTRHAVTQGTQYPRVLDLCDADYFGGTWDPRPAFSQSIAKHIHQRSARHAWRAHQRLGGTARPMTDQMRLGKVADAALFGTLGGWEILGADTWKGSTMSAKLKLARFGAPVCLQHECDDAERGSIRVLDALVNFGLFLGETQVIAAWETECISAFGDRPFSLLHSAKFDSIDTDKRIIWDLKRTTDANPATLDRQIARMCWHIQAAAYTEAAAWCFGGEVDDWRFIIVADDGEDVVPREVSGEYMVAGRAAWEGARHVWATCLERCAGRYGEQRHWPSYVDSVLPADCPKWLTMRNDDDVEGGYDLAAMTEEA